MAILNEQNRTEISQQLENMEGPVKIVCFTQELECQYCRETKELLTELTDLSDKLTLETYNFITDKEIVEKFNIDKVPATIIMNDEKDYGIRFYGIPSGYEFASILQDILLVSKSDSGLSEDSRKKLANLEEPLHLQVFVTPTCPYCPRAVALAHQFAIESDKVTADMVEAIEFPHLSQRYQVMGVPKTIANEKSAAEGALPEAHFLQKVLETLTEETETA
ncbi:MAG: glutaredoxin [Candidatus Latescibacteria bacterium 4484_7]|nr:MAG: glutaredoxin [Candidatus Latescibacteria bacterium 4484_7]